MASPRSTTVVRWRLTAGEPPRVRRRCRSCRADCPFVSTDRFRLNANGRRLDVWLIYRCSACDARWNREIYARVNPRTLNPSLYQKLLENDAAIARRWAFDVAGLRALGVRVDEEVPFRISLDRIPPLRGLLRIHLDFVDPLSVRLDKLLAQGLGVPRSRIRSWYDRGTLRLAGRSEQSRVHRRGVGSHHEEVVSSSSSSL